MKSYLGRLKRLIFPDLGYLVIFLVFLLHSIREHGKIRTCNEGSVLYQHFFGSMKMEAKIEKGMLRLAVPLMEKKLSKSGKTYLVASVSEKTSVTIEDQPVRVTLNAFVPNPDYKG